MFSWPQGDDDVVDDDDGVDHDGIDDDGGAADDDDGDDDGVDGMTMVMVYRLQSIPLMLSAYPQWLMSCLDSQRNSHGRPRSRRDSGRRICISSFIAKVSRARCGWEIRSWSEPVLQKKSRFKNLTSPK